MMYGTLIFLSYVYYDELQYVVDISYNYLLSTWIFNSVYFESVWTVVANLFIITFPYVVDKIKFFDKYKIDPKLKWKERSLPENIYEAVEYPLPFLFLDTFMVKQYTGTGIDPAIWKERRKTLIQTTRELPTLPPTVFQIWFHIVASMVIYDIFFFCIHFAVHKNATLYKYLHKNHHEHEVLDSRITNKMSVIERVGLVLSANQALRIMHAHPLTRMIFVPFFLGWITENHCGYDFPWTLDKVVPFGLVGGSLAHYKHHMHGTPHYQSFFTYLDWMLEKMRKRKIRKKIE